ncbi:hypothetical protein V1478_013686 [Vespula squamosa]|uniref:Uncharacterized protein n=1 Tax=Vespula squamosa TaxID=30214 RepID=A0ABD2A5X4_VESSQ
MTRHYQFLVFMLSDVTTLMIDQILLCVIELVYISSLIMSLAFSPIMITGALVFPLTMAGIIEASTTRKPFTPYTLNFGSTTAVGSFLGPILHVPTG